MNPKLITKNEFKVIGLKITCDWSQLHMEMLKLWNDFTLRVGEIKNRTNEYMIDINLQVVQNEFTELICVEVNDLCDIPDGMTGLVIPTQTYAYTQHEAPIEDIWKTFGELQSWIKETGRVIDPLDFKMDYCLNDSSLPHELYQKIV
jgi:predicted transcriptional regulator YdeE